MAGPARSRHRKGSRGQCSYCGRRHKKGKKGDSCRRGVDAEESTVKKPKLIGEVNLTGKRVRTKPMGQRAVIRRKKARERFQISRKLTDQQRLDKQIEKGYPDSKESRKLRERIARNGNED